MSFEATSDKLQNCEAVSNKNFSGNAIGLVIGDGKNPNDFSIQLVSVEKLSHPEIEHDGTIKIENLKQCTPITPKPPSSQVIKHFTRLITSKRPSSQVKEQCIPITSKRPGYQVKKQCTPITRRSPRYQVSVKKSNHPEIQQDDIIEEENLEQSSPVAPKSPNSQAPVAEVSNESETISTEEIKASRRNILPYKCDICERGFTRNYAVVRHKKNIHKIDVPLSSVLPCKTIPKKYPCRICKAKFLKVVDRMNHEKTSHESFRHIRQPKLQCSECLSTFYGNKAVIEHISEDHSNINMETETLTFKSFDEFKEWKIKVEKNTMSKYIRDKFHKTKRFSILSYSCHRSGLYKSQSAGKRKVKFKGSIKTGFYCPASIQLKTYNANDCSLEVKFLSTHLGHEHEIELLNMEDRLTIKRDIPNLHKCRVCLKFFKSSNNRKIHEKLIHNLDEPYNLKLKCPQCFSIFPTKKEIMCHFSKSHRDIDLTAKLKTFKTLKEFEEWKLAVEKETKSEYVLERSYPTTNAFLQWYTCHLNGTSETRSFCPASVLVKLHYIDKTIHVTYQPTHVGHRIEMPCVQLAGLLSNLNDDVKKSHRNAEKIINSVSIVRNDENTWTIFRSFNAETCQVKRLGIDPTHVCALKCHSCNICEHEFACNCSDAVLHGICTHIHIIYLKFFQGVKEGDDSSCNVDDMIFSDHADTNESESNVLQEIEGNQQFMDLRNQAVAALSSLHTAINECRTKKRLKELIVGLSSLKDKMDVNLPSTSSKGAHVLKQPPCEKSSMNLILPDALHKVIKFKINPDSPS